MDLHPHVNGTVSAIAAAPNASTVYIGGPCSTVDGQPDTDISTLDRRTGNTVGPGLQNVTGYLDDLDVNPDGQYLLAADSGVSATRCFRGSTMARTAMAPRASTVEVHQDTFGSSDITFLASPTGRS